MFWLCIVYSDTRLHHVFRRVGLIYNTYWPNRIHAFGDAICGVSSFSADNAENRIDMVGGLIIGVDREVPGRARATRGTSCSSRALGRSRERKLMKVKVTVSGVTVECEAEEMPPAFSPSGAIDPLFPSPMTDRRDYDKRMGIVAKHHLTVGSAIDATWIVDRVKERIAGKTVVECGAGVGYLAVELAKHAKHVFAIEADVKWSWEFADKLYETKPRNLTWIFDRIETCVEVMALRADVAIVVTGSDDIWLKQLAGKMAPEVIMPWQDYNGGKAMIADGGLSL